MGWSRVDSGAYYFSLDNSDPDIDVADCDITLVGALAGDYLFAVVGSWGGADHRRVLHHDGSSIVPDEFTFLGSTTGFGVSYKVCEGFEGLLRTYTTTTPGGGVVGSAVFDVALFLMRWTPGTDILPFNALTAGYFEDPVDGEAEAVDPLHPPDNPGFSPESFLRFTKVLNGEPASGTAMAPQLTLEPATLGPDAALLGDDTRYDVAYSNDASLADSRVDYVDLPGRLMWYPLSFTPVPEVPPGAPEGISLRLRKAYATELPYQLTARMLGADE